ncbi:C40 family peptidase [Lachnospiraceae bacterium 42-17]|jgi:cell wall-associated NlpC family hydrolase|nr:C40 family peptidase [Dorea sp.]
MDSVLRKGLFLVTLTGAVAAFPATAHASDIDQVHLMPGVGIEQVLNDCYASDKEIEVEDYLVPTQKGEYLDMAFADVDSFLFVRSEPTTQSEWVGKLYPDYAARIIGPVGEWTKVQSGSVTGYVYSEYIIIGNNAEQKAHEIIENTEKPPEEAFTYAESREEEAERLAREEQEAAAKKEEEIKALAGSGQAVVDYACQFIGNPYVWGGTSLTDGADCSGFVQSVFANFGISLPRTTWDQENVGIGVSYEEALPGDLILYEGHVGIYMGNGQIVNAMNESDGIGICPATYTPIKTVRRVL